MVLWQSLPPYGPGTLQCNRSRLDAHPLPVPGEGQWHDGAGYSWCVQVQSGEAAGPLVPAIVAGAALPDCAKCCWAGDVICIPSGRVGIIARNVFWFWVSRAQRGRGGPGWAYKLPACVQHNQTSSGNQRKGATMEANPQDTPEKAGTSQAQVGCWADHFCAFCTI